MLEGQDSVASRLKMLTMDPSQIDFTQTTSVLFSKVVTTLCRKTKGKLARPATNNTAKLFCSY